MVLRFALAAVLLIDGGAALDVGPPQLTAERIHALFPSAHPAQFQQLHAIGWTKDGLFAYAISDATGESDERHDVFALQNLKNDESVAHAQVTAPLSSAPPLSTALEHERDFVAALRTHGLTATDARLRTDSPSGADGPVALSVDGVTGQEDDFGQKHVQQWSVVATGKKGRKVPASDWREVAATAPVKIAVLGWFQSPVEARVAVVVGEQYSVGEGDTVVRLVVYGAALNTGFKK